MTERYSIVLADDHVMVRRGLKRLFDHKADLQIVGEAGDGLELLKLLGKVTPHLVILDISMPNLQGMEAIAEIKLRQPDVKILILTMHKEEAYLFRALSAGADGYIVKEEAEDELFNAISRIQKGKVYVSSCLSRHSIGDWVNNLSEEGDLRLSESLSLREREVLKLVAENKSNKEISGLLGISVRTVERHRANLCSKLKIKGTAALVRYALNKQFV